MKSSSGSWLSSGSSTQASVPSTCLTEVCCEGDNFAVVGFLQPLQNDRGVKASAVGKHYFIDLLSAGSGGKCLHPDRQSAVLCAS